MAIQEGAIAFVNYQVQGLVEKIFPNHLGQICYQVRGQIYSDPPIFQVYIVGQLVHAWRFDQESRREEYGRILEIQETGDKVALKCEMWDEENDCWKIPEVFTDLRFVSPCPEFRESIPKERAIVVNESIMNNVGEKQ